MEEIENAETQKNGSEPLFQLQEEDSWEEQQLEKAFKQNIIKLKDNISNFNLSDYKLFFSLLSKDTFGRIGFKEAGRVLGQLEKDGVITRSGTKKRKKYENDWNFIK